MADGRVSGWPIAGSVVFVRMMQTAFRWAMVTFATGVLSFVQMAGAAEEQDFRTVAIPRREHGYSGIQSMVIASQAEWDAVLQKLGGQNTWNARGIFLAAIREANVDFGKEALVLLRHTEGSGSTQVAWRDPRLRDRTLHCEIVRKAAGIGTADMAFYCFAVAVRKAEVKQVELRIAGRKPVVLKVTD